MTFEVTNPCGNSCPNCIKDVKSNESWIHYFRPIWKEDVISFLKNNGKLPFDATYNNLVGLVWKDDYWTKEIFGIASVYKYHVEAMFLQLIAARLVAAEMFEGKLCWVVCREKGKSRYPPHRFDDDKNWDGIYLRDDPKNK